MADTSYTFSGPTHQSSFSVVDDPSKPGWDDVPTLTNEESTELEPAKERKASGSRGRDLIQQLKKR